jgi:hypothetical protein
MNRKAVAILNCVGREEAPMLEQPVYEEGGKHFVFEQDSRRKSFLETGVLEELVEDEQATMIEPQPAVENGVVLVTQDLDEVRFGDVESAQVKLLYLSVPQARARLARLSLAYFRRGEFALNKGDLKVAHDCFGKAARSYPNGLSVRALLIALASLQGEGDWELFDREQLDQRIVRMKDEGSRGKVWAQPDLALKLCIRSVLVCLTHRDLVKATGSVLQQGLRGLRIELAI